MHLLFLQMHFLIVRYYFLLGLQLHFSFLCYANQYCVWHQKTEQH